MVILQELSLINSLAQEYTDAWRAQHADVTDVYTVWDERTNARAANKGLRIDYILCSPALHIKVTNCQVKLDIPQVRFQAPDSWRVGV
jgi:exonuclease III